MEVGIAQTLVSCTIRKSYSLFLSRLGLVAVGLQLMLRYYAPVIIAKRFVSCPLYSCDNSFRMSYNA